VSATGDRSDRSVEAKHLSDDVTVENVYMVLRYQTPVCPHLHPYEPLAQAAEDFIRVILDEVPRCADRSSAIRKIREALLTASAAVSLTTATRGRASSDRERSHQERE